MNKLQVALVKIAVIFYVCYGGSIEPVKAADKNPAVHQHGIAVANIMIDSGEVEIEFEVPAEDVVGFESEPVTKAQKESVKNGVLKLQRGKEIFILPKSAGCVLEKTAITSALIEKNGAIHESHGKESHEGHDKHSHGKESHEGHDKHGHGKESHEDHDKHGNDGLGQHSEFTATYHFNCEEVGQVDNISIDFFKLFPTTQKIRVQFVGPNGQGSSTVTPSSRNISFN